MKKLFVLFSCLIILPARADFENMCGVDGYSVFNAVWEPYAPSEYDNGPFNANDVFTCAANTPRVMNAVFTPYLASEYNNGPFYADDVFTCAANTPRILNAVFEPEIYICDPGYYVPANIDGCVICPENNYCPGGTYTFNETETQGINACLGGLVAPVGMWDAAQCGHILHVGSDIVYLHSVKKTSPAVHVSLGNEIFYGNMTMADVPMNVDTTHKLKLQYNGVDYSVYDDTVVVDE